ncbi:MAG: pyrroline-5-carboxylate reductase [Acidimicrobiia bacterium]|nr:pyrroline-5-carboxylate reductase [Acidimicrobiia bacterium]NNC93257.1 pyrroline-5-carboxylate reductase [Acidimicrobiia bacterium]
MKPTVAILGAGALGEILAGGLLRAGWSPDELSLADRREERASELTERLGVVCHLDPVVAASGKRVVVVVVKPKDVPGLLEQIKDALKPGQVVLSLAAGVPLSVYEKALGEIAVVRGMPNTPALVDEAITAYAPGQHVSEKTLEEVASVMEAVGKTIVLDEQLMDAVTAVSGTGPAYVYLLAEALTDAAIREGLPRHAAQLLVDQTLKGTGALLAETALSPIKLRAQVTSPGGTTAAAVHVLEESGFRAAIEDAVRAAAERSREMGEAAAEADG